MRCGTDWCLEPLIEFPKPSTARLLARVQIDCRRGSDAVLYTMHFTILDTRHAVRRLGDTSPERTVNKARIRATFGVESTTTQVQNLTNHAKGSMRRSQIETPMTVLGDAQHSANKVKVESFTLKCFAILMSLFAMHIVPVQAVASGHEAVVTSLQLVDKLNSGDVDAVKRIVKADATRKRGKPGSLISDMLRDLPHRRAGNPMSRMRLQEIVLVRNDELERLKNRTLQHARERGINVAEDEAAVSADVFAKGHKLTENRTLCMLFYTKKADDDQVRPPKLIAVTLEKIEGKLLVVHLWDD